MQYRVIAISDDMVIEAFDSPRDDIATAYVKEEHAKGGYGYILQANEGDYWREVFWEPRS